MLERVIGLFHEAGIDDVRVVIGHRSTDLLPLVRNSYACPIVNEHYEAGMFSSVIAGVKSLEEEIDAFFLLPVDIPLVRRTTIVELQREYASSGSHILYPSFCGKRGHPPLIPGRYREGILNWNSPGGLKSCLSKYEADAADVEVIDELMLLDMDTPGDYQMLHSIWRRHDIPTFRECEAILNKYAVGERLVRHCREVERLSRFLAEKLNEVCCRLDLDLVSAAALLHDVAKGRPGHAKEGSLLLSEMGYPGVADIVACHMDIILNDDDSISEKEIIYLADKMIWGEQRVPIEVRFNARVDSHAHDDKILKTVAGRLENALRIQKSVETLLGQSMREVLDNSE